MWRWRLRRRRPNANINTGHRYKSSAIINSLIDGLFYIFRFNIHRVVDRHIHTNLFQLKLFIFVFLDSERTGDCHLW